MATTDRKTKKTLKSLTIVGAILIVALILSLVYFFVIKKDPEEGGTDLSKITCGCYIIDPEIVNECGDPKRAFLFNLNTVSSDQICNAKCDINDIADNLLNSTTPRDSYKVCTVRSISDTRCENMILKDQDGKIITGKIQPTDEINVEATFDKSDYIDYGFKINNESTQPDKVDGNKISKKISSFENITSVEVMATAKDAQGDTINSIVCRRIVDIETSSSSAVTGMVAITEQQSDGKTKISNISISVGQIDSSNVKIRFSFEPTFTTLTALDGITVEPTKGTIEMSKLDLYDEKNFSNDSFNVLNDHVGNLKITAEIFVSEVNIGSASTIVVFTNATTPPDEPITKDEKSSFTASKSADKECVERTEGNNLATYTITVTNNRDTQDEITSIKDKLPLGFIYTPNSSVLNGATVSDSGLVTVTSVGDTQEIVWEPTTPWSVVSGGTLSIVFQATAGTTALTGQNLNEIIVNPVEIPLDPASLRSQVNIVVADDCSNAPKVEPVAPKTGIFDNFFVRIGLGIFILIIGWLIYVRPEGATLTESLLKSKIYDNFEFRKYKITNPKKYFEEKILRKKSRGNR